MNGEELKKMDFVKLLCLVGVSYKIQEKKSIRS